VTPETRIDMTNVPLFSEDEAFLVWDAFCATLFDEYEVVTDPESRYATAYMVAWAYGQMCEGVERTLARARADELTDEGMRLYVLFGEAWNKQAEETILPLFDVRDELEVQLGPAECDRIMQERIKPRMWAIKRKIDREA
jgi:hypothetical protein